MLKTNSMVLHSFNNFAELTDALVAQWIDIIDSAAAERLPAYFALAGGSTPAPIYRQLDQLLSQRDVNNVNLVATDERWVEDTDAQSNEGLFKKSMASSYRRQWNLISLKNDASTPEIATEAISHRLAQQIPKPFNAVLLGMGADGHVASLFPQAPTQHDDLACLAALHPQTHQSRMSLSLPRLLDADRIWLVIIGAEKRQVLEGALDTTAGSALPISVLLQEASCDVDVFWCP